MANERCRSCARANDDPDMDYGDVYRVFAAGPLCFDHASNACCHGRDVFSEECRDCPKT